MSGITDLLAKPIFLLSLGAAVAGGGGAYYYLIPADTQVQSGSQTPAVTTGSPVQTILPFPSRFNVTLEGGNIREGDFCDLARTPQMICEVVFRDSGSPVNRKFYIQRYPHDPSRGMIYLEYGGSQQKPNAADITAEKLPKGVKIADSAGQPTGLTVYIKPAS
jgi:hypothetical protein